jgi:DNA-binding HxlR family transcriptional regulator
VIGTRLYESHPPRYEYFLTDKGMALGPVLKALYTWGGATVERRAGRFAVRLPSRA